MTRAFAKLQIDSQCHNVMYIDRSIYISFICICFAHCDADRWIPFERPYILLRRALQKPRDLILKNRICLLLQGEFILVLNSYFIILNCHYPHVLYLPCNYSGNDLPSVIPEDDSLGSFEDPVTVRRQGGGRPTSSSLRPPIVGSASSSGVIKISKSGQIMQKRSCRSGASK